MLVGRKFVSGGSGALRPAQLVGRIGEAGMLAGRARDAARLAEADQLPSVFVPERQTKALQALAQRQPVRPAQLGVVAQHLGKPVAWDTGREMMDMVHADI